MPPNEGLSTSKDFRDALTECCVEFITLIASEANDISEKETKKTIACEHVTAALKELGFSEYINPVQESAEEYKKQQSVGPVPFAPHCRAPINNRQTREKKQSKMEQSGLSEEELLRQQQELFRSATDKFNSTPHEAT